MRRAAATGSSAKREAEPVALFFAAQGFNTCVVRYSVYPEVYPAALCEMAAVISYIRKNSGSLHSHPDKISVMGFSAGGHLAGEVCCRYNDAQILSKLNVTSDDIRPNAAILCYPVISAGEYAHRDSFNALTGCEDLNKHAEHSLENLVTGAVPPTFIWCTYTDQAVPAINTMLYAQALYRNGIPAEMHVYPVGPHGSSLSRDFTCHVSRPDKAIPECEEWTDKAISFLKRTFTGRGARV